MSLVGACHAKQYGSVSSPAYINPIGAGTASSSTVVVGTTVVVGATVVVGLLLL